MTEYSADIKPGLIIAAYWLDSPKQKVPPDSVYGRVSTKTNNKELHVFTGGCDCFKIPWSKLCKVIVFIEKARWEYK